MSDSTEHVTSMRALLEAGVHFGHRTPRWNPKMKSYIFTQRNGIHIIDLQQTINYIDTAYKLVFNIVSDGGIVIFVGTKKQAQETIREEAEKCNMPYVNQRWLGGTLTNWRTIRQRIDYLLDLERRRMRGEFARLVKKEALQREKEIERLNKRLGGLKGMTRLPNLLFVTDVRRETIAIKEAQVLGIPILAMVDTNCDPDPIDYIIPANDDAIRAIRLITETITKAVIEGVAVKSAEEAEWDEVDASTEDDMERYLGPSTLAKIREAQEAEQAAAVSVDAADDEENDFPEDIAQVVSQLVGDFAPEPSTSTDISEAVKNATDAEVDTEAEASAQVEAVVEDEVAETTSVNPEEDTDTEAEASAQVEAVVEDEDQPEDEVAETTSVNPEEDTDTEAEASAQVEAIVEDEDQPEDEVAETTSVNPEEDTEAEASAQVEAVVEDEVAETTSVNPEEDTEAEASAQVEAVVEDEVAETTFQPDLVSEQISEDVATVDETDSTDKPSING